MREETRTKMIPDTKKVFIAEDGQEFTDEIACQRYEMQLLRDQRSGDLLFCKEADGWCNCNGAENMDYHHYSWVFVRNDTDAELLNRMYDCEYDSFEEHIGEWVCIEQTDDDDFYLTSATQGIKYATSLLEKLGYEVKITRKDEQK